ncbi:MAG: 4-cresol dehydrogenase [hydroxylating] flavoprotein subunit [Pseudomonadota bacterium]|jgi:4-cresol dehydrogenase (hydroxylating)
MNIYFDRQDEEQAARTHSCNEQLHLGLLERGFRFYRLDIENMRQVVRDKSPYWQTVQLLKGALDPDSIIAPRRYNLI